MELLNHAPVTPYRLQAMLRLVPRLRNPSQAELCNLLQPADLLKGQDKKQDASNDVFKAAVNLRLLAADENNIVRLMIDREQIETPTAFRQLMQHMVLGVTDDTHDNFLFNIYSAWYAVQDARVLEFTLKEFETRFNEQVYPDAEERSFNTTKLNGWRQWAVFLGLGWTLRSGNAETVVPDATERIEPLLPMLLPQTDVRIEVGSFMTTISDLCPELDGGRLFTQCWQACRASDSPSHRMSLMLSNALRVLHDEGTIELIRLADASNTWHLYQAEGHPVTDITHIRRRSHT